MHGPGVGHVDPAVGEIGFQDDGVVTVAKVHTKSDEDSIGRCSPVSLALGSVPLCFNRSVKIQILACIVVINSPVSLLTIKGLIRHTKKNKNAGLYWEK